MGVQARIEGKLQNTFKPLFLEVVNESNKHNVPPGSESHFKVVIVSDNFEKIALPEQHRLIYAALAEEMQLIHALAIQSKTPSQWQKSAQYVRSTPLCLGGDKKND